MMPEHSARVLSWAQVVDDANYYEILGLTQKAATPDIKGAFHDFAAAFHPDVHQGDSEDVLQATLKVYTSGVEAYRVLSDPSQRSRYDLLLAKGGVRLHSDRPQAESQSRSIRSLDEVCHTAAARRHAISAEKLIVAGDFNEARRELQIALSHDGGQNTGLEDRIDALDLVLFASGD